MKVFNSLQWSHLITCSLESFAIFILVGICIFAGSSYVFAAGSAQLGSHNSVVPRHPLKSSSPDLPLAGGTNPTLPGWTLTFDDEFNTTHLNTAQWNIEDSGSGGYKNCCLNFGLQYYTPQALTLRQGALRIASERQNLGGKNYASGAITTENKFDFLYGRVDIRARVPKGKGMWPAWWMLTPNSDHEVDIMEVVNNPTTVYETYHVHVPTTNSVVSQCTVKGNDLSTAFHTYSLVWSATALTWYIDGVQMCKVTASLPRSPMYLLLDTAVGGSWPGAPDAHTVFPQYTAIDYVRVYQSSLQSFCSGLLVTTPLQLDRTVISGEGAISATVTYTNRCSTPFVLNRLIVAVRTPDGGNADFSNQFEPVTLLPGQSITITASSRIKITDPSGQWYAFSSYKTPDGKWHEDTTNREYFTVSR